MNSTDHSTPTPTRELRLWPAILLIVLMVVARVFPKLLGLRDPIVLTVSFLGPALCGILLLLGWWLASSRAAWKDRIVGVLGVAGLAVIAGFLSDRSMLPLGYMMYAIPWGMAAFGIGVVGASLVAIGKPVWIGLLASLIAFGYWDAVRSDGVNGDFRDARSWRWEPTAEERFMSELATRAKKPGELATSLEKVAEVTEAEWPGFRGVHRDNAILSAEIDIDWEVRPPRELWRHAIGPAWSSFAVAGNRLFTQEQRGEMEAVTCYDADTGDELWALDYPSRFWEAIAGAGPRGTPTWHNGHLFTLGAEGILQCITANTGAQIWQRDLREDASRKPPMWGFSASPLVVDQVVLVHAGGDGDRGVLAYDVETGDLAWSAPSGDHTYSSPHLVELLGRSYVLMLCNDGLCALDPTDGSVAWKHAWGMQGYRVVQPLVFGESRILLGTGMEEGTRCINIDINGDQLDTTEVWTERSIKPNYNDYVAHEGYLYGFDHNIFACIDLETGARQWKKGRYGNGQVLLLPDANQLLVMTEQGELIVLRTNPEKLEVLARHPVLNGKTWNHHVLVGNRVYARNAEEMAAYELPMVVR